MQFYIYKTTVKLLRCHRHPRLWLTEPHGISVSCISENRRGQYQYLKQLSICSRRHPSDKMIKRSAFQTMTPAGQQRCRLWALVWLCLSGRISSEKSLPTLGRKISKENHPPPPPALVWTVCKWDFPQAEEGNRAELVLTAGQPLNFWICSCRKKQQISENKVWESWFFFWRALLLASFACLWWEVGLARPGSYFFLLVLRSCSLSSENFMFQWYNKTLLIQKLRRVFPLWGGFCWFGSFVVLLTSLYS